MAGLGTTFYRETLYPLSTTILQRQGSSHGIFVPFISSNILWLKFDRIKAIKLESDLLPGGLMLLGGIVLLFLSRTGLTLLFSSLSFLCIVSSLILLLLGKQIFKETMFPLFFLATMIPLPPAIYKQISYWIRLINTFGSVALTKSLGIPLYSEGFYVYLPRVNLFIADACSGIRYLLSYFTFSLVYAVLFKHGMLARLVVILGSFPLAIFAGITRLSVIFLSTYYISPVMAEQRPHTILSWIVFVIFLVGAIGIDRFLSKIKNQTGEQNISSNV